ncbi:anti-sigma factor family protein [Dongia sedimenti]|uniref:Anti-sigma factor n=1 Tax=Dongia sedimenti TaxID=3064282 RepID=A0ABU0YGP6_9PROT|nr:anti-sigma factor [Rhodospirillaceae bacterium R-7]
MTVDRPITEDDLQAHIDGALDPKREAAVERYLAEHPDVARRIETQAGQRAALRAAFAPIAEEPLPPSLNLDRLIAARRRPAVPTWRAAAAAVILLAAGGTSGWLLRDTLATPESGVTALAREAADSYAVFAVDRSRPVEIRAEATDQLVRWISNRLNRSIAVPDLSASGYRFMGGRLVPTPHGPAGMLMYDDDRGTRLVMLVRPMEAEQDAPMAPSRNGDIAGYTWAQGGLGYSLVGPAAPDVLHPLADAARRQISGAI